MYCIRLYGFRREDARQAVRVPGGSQVASLQSATRQRIARRASDMTLLGIDGCEDICEETLLSLIVCARYLQSGAWAEVAEAVAEVANDPEAATPVPALDPQVLNPYWSPRVPLLLELGM